MRFLAAKMFEALSKIIKIRSIKKTVLDSRSFYTEHIWTSSLINKYSTVLLPNEREILGSN